MVLWSFVRIKASYTPPGLLLNAIPSWQTHITRGLESIIEGLFFILLALTCGMVYNLANKTMQGAFMMHASMFGLWPSVMLLDKSNVLIKLLYLYLFSLRLLLMEAIFFPMLPGYIKVASVFHKFAMFQCHFVELTLLSRICSLMGNFHNRQAKYSSELCPFIFCPLTVEQDWSCVKDTPHSAT